MDLSSDEGFHRNRIGSEAVEELKKLFSMNKILTIINLKGLLLKIEDIEIISTGIERNQTLQYLNLASNEILHSINSSAAFYSLIFKSKLLKFDISGNAIGQMVFIIRQ